MNKEYQTRLETLLDFFRCASANKNIKTIEVEGTGFLDDAEIIIDLIEKELKKLNKQKYVSDKNVGNKENTKDLSAIEFLKHAREMCRSNDCKQCIFTACNNESLYIANDKECRICSATLNMKDNEIAELVRTVEKEYKKMELKNE